MVLFAAQAFAHVGVVNVQTPYAVAGKSYELVLAVPHGCSYTTSGGAEAAADTYKIEVSIPAGFTGARPIVDGVFGKPTVTKDPNGVVTAITFEKPVSLDAEGDDHSYRVAIRSTAPNAPFTSAQFNVKQSCRNPAGGADLVIDLGELRDAREQSVSEGEDLPDARTGLEQVQPRGDQREAQPRRGEGVVHRLLQ